MGRVIRFGPDPLAKREAALRKLTVDAKLRYLRKHAPAKAKLVDRAIDNLFEDLLHRRG